ncbi:hypothetical protein VNI00_003700 [Paramarasmius palmivorus]|uniref:Uncharacterized protein n=1 Tax=Paramarasmius palmivorus TaxID=297713 RepID=A0AAW0DP29_9AGAR
MVIFEYSSAILMIIRSVQAFRVNGAWRAQKGGFLYMIFEQGLFYFSVVSLFTTAAVVLNYRAPSGFFQRLLNALTLPLSGLLTARFLLHLRKWEHKQNAHGVSGETPNSDTMGSFQAAPGRGQSTLMSTIIDEFGNDPVAIASSSKKNREVGTTTIKPETQLTNVVEETSSATGSGPSSSSGDLANSVKEEKRPEPTINASHFV